MRLVLLLAMTFVLSSGCKKRDAKALGDECFGTAECGAGLTCDFGQSPPSCQSMQTPKVNADAGQSDAPVAGDGDGDG